MPENWELDIEAETELEILPNQPITAIKGKPNNTLNRFRMIILLH